MVGKRRRVVITGMGLVSPLGVTVDALWQAIQAGRSGVGEMTLLPSAAFPIDWAAEATEFREHISDFGELPTQLVKTIRKALRLMCRECQMGVAAGQKALFSAGIAPESLDPLRCGVSYNSDYMITLPEELTEAMWNCMDRERSRLVFSEWADRGMPHMNPLWQLKYLPNMPAAHLAILNQFRGPNNSVTLREAGIGAALGEAFHIVADGRADVMLVGGTGTRLHPVKTIHAIQTEELAIGKGDPAQAVRPFDLDRMGTVLGEGAGAIVIESLEHAQARGVSILGEVLGGAYTATMTRDRQSRRKEALVNSLRQLLRQTGKTPDDIGHINAHGLGTRSCDIEEAEAIHEIFGQRETPTPVTAPKSYFGNLGAGGGLVEMIAGIEALRRGEVFATRNYATPDPACPVDVVTQPRPAGSTMIKLSVSPQGQAGVAMLAAYRE